MLSRLLPPLAFGTGLYVLILVGSALAHGSAGVDGLWLARRLPGPATGIVATAVALGLLAYAWGYLRAPLPRAALAAALALLTAWALLDVGSYLRLVLRDAIKPGELVPASALVATLFAILTAYVLGAVPGSHVPSHEALRLDADKRPLLLGLLVPLAAPFVQFATFGTTRYEREADVALVMGAGVFAGGRVSQAAATRVDEAVRLHQRGLVKRVVMLAGDENEGTGMAAYAVARGLPAEAVSYRSDCVNTERAAALSSEDLAATSERALVVSHYYHLPRIRLLYAREGARIWTVPAVMERRLRLEPYYLLREVASTYHELLFRSAVGPHLKRWLQRSSLLLDAHTGDRRPAADDFAHVTLRVP
jgi:uncharacterized SAM-binding protein YcdF (DUF218 family)